MSQTNGMKLPRSWPPPLSSAISPSQACSFSLTDPCTREKVISALDSEVAKFRTIAFAASTRRTYSSQQAMYLRFCSCMDIKPVPVSSVNLGRYVAFLASKLCFSSIRQYLNMVRIMHLELGYGSPLSENFWFDFCFTALRHILGHFGRGQLT